MSTYVLTVKITFTHNLFVHMHTLGRRRTSDGEFGGCRGRSQKPIGRRAGVVPRILWEEAGDEERSVHHDLDPGLQRPDNTHTHTYTHTHTQTHTHTHKIGRAHV